MFALDSPTDMPSPTPTEEVLQQENRQLRQQLIDLSAAVSRLKETSDLYRIVADTAADAILCINEEDEIIYANPSTKTLLGHSPARLIGRRLTTLIPPEYHARHHKGFRQFISSGEKSIRWSGVELVVLHADGSHIPVEVSFGAVQGEDGHYRFSGFIRDSRPRKRLEKESRDRLAALAHANRLKSVGELASGLAHELNQPLSAVCLYADLALAQVEELKLESTLRENLEMTVAQAERAADIIRILRELIRKNEPRREPVDLNSAINAVVQLMRSEIDSRSIQLHLQLSEIMPAIHADRTQIEQIVLNLIQNALEAISVDEKNERKISVQTEVIDSLAHVIVTDSGCGLPEGNEQQVFENFFSTKKEGLGIGLGICRSIAEMHQGQILARNHEPAGACFTLILPCHHKTSQEVL